MSPAEPPTEERHDPRCVGLRYHGIPVPPVACTCAAIARQVREADARRARQIRPRN